MRNGRTLTCGLGLTKAHLLGTNFYETCLLASELSLSGALSGLHTDRSTGETP